MLLLPLATPKHVARCWCSFLTDKCSVPAAASAASLEHCSRVAPAKHHCHAVSACKTSTACRQFQSLQWRWQVCGHTCLHSTTQVVWMTFVKNHSTHSSTTIRPRRGMMKEALALMLRIIMPVSCSAVSGSAAQNTYVNNITKQTQPDKVSLHSRDQLLLSYCRITTAPWSISCMLQAPATPKSSRVPFHDTSYKLCRRGVYACSSADLFPAAVVPA